MKRTELGTCSFFPSGRFQLRLTRASPLSSSYLPSITYGLSFSSFTSVLCRTSRPAILSQKRSSTSHQNLYEPASGAFMTPRQRTEKLSPGIPCIGEFHPHLKSIFASGRTIGLPWQPSFGK